MTEDINSPLLLFLVFVLIVGVGSLLFGDFNNRVSRLFRQAAIWVMIFLGAVLLFSFRGDLEDALLSRNTVAMDGNAVVLERARDGHFYASIMVNGVEIPFVVDTGATQVVLTQADAQRVGIDTDQLRFLGLAHTANGTVRTAPVTLQEMRLGERVDQNVRASVNGGELFTSLLGMSYLNRFSKLEIERNRMRLLP